jgi:TolB-like protein
MKKLMFTVLISIFEFGIFAQELPTVAVAIFEPVGGVSRDEANIVTELFMAELVNTRAVKVADRSNFDKILAEMKFQLSDWSNDQKTTQLGRAINAEYIIYGQFMKMGTMFYLTATILDINAVQRIISERYQFKNQDQIFNALPSFCKQIVTKIPAPEYLYKQFIGRWQSEDNISSSRKCIIEFKENGILRIERLDLYEIRISNDEGSYSLSLDGTIRMRYDGPRNSQGAFHVDDAPYTFNSTKDKFSLHGSISFEDYNRATRRWVYTTYNTFVKIK